MRATSMVRVLLLAVAVFGVRDIDDFEVVAKTNALEVDEDKEALDAVDEHDNALEAVDEHEDALEAMHDSKKLSGMLQRGSSVKVHSNTTIAHVLNGQQSLWSADSRAATKAAKGSTWNDGPPISGTINAMQWSAHWKCFNVNFFAATCAPMVEELLETWLSNYKLDFVNLGMFQDDSWNPPSNYGFLDYKCSRDNIKVLYDNTKWQLSALQKLPDDLVATVYHPPKDTDVFGCSNENADGSADRVYGVMAFEQRKKNSKVIVVAGHLPHPPGGSSSAANSVAMSTAPLLREQLAPKIKYIKEQPGWEDASVLFIGDTNNNIDANRAPAFDNATNIEEAFAVMDDRTVEAVKKMEGQIRDVHGVPIEKPVGEALEEPNRGWIEQPIMTSEDIWEALQTNYPVSATKPSGTCCADKPAMVGDSVAFPYTFDRIMASFGPLHTIMPLQVLLKKSDAADELIQKLFVGAFHMPIIAVVEWLQ